MNFLHNRSIRFRLTAWYAVIFAATFAVAGLCLLLAMRKAAQDTVDKDLRARLPEVRQYVAEQINEHADGDAVATDLEEDGAARPGGAWLRLADSAGQWIYRAPRTAEWDSAVPSRRGLPPKGRAATIRIHGRPIRVLTAPVPSGLVQMGMPMDEFAEMISGFAWTLALASPLLLLLASAGGYWMSGRALMPVDTITAKLRAIGAGNLSERLPLRGTADELDRLSDTTNEMLTRLEAAFARVTRFTADASHELRTPVAIIRTTAEVTSARQRPSADHEAAWHQVIAQTERTSRLIDDLLTLARADSACRPPALEPVDLADLLSGVLAEMGLLADAAGVRLASNVPPVCLVNGVPDALRRILINLIDNAVKYTQRGGTVTVTLRSHDAPAGSAVVVEVQDTGSGISAEDLPYIFDRFYRTGADRSRSTGGGGLGLSIAQSLAALHGGEIEVASVVGWGSVFRLRLGPGSGHPTPASPGFQNPGPQSDRS